MSTYCAQADIEEIFGSQAVDKWLTVNSDDGAAAKLARVNRAIAYAGDVIDDVMRLTSYKIPCVTSAAAVPTTIKNIASVIAGVWLFEIRGVENIQMQDGHPMHRHYIAKRDALEYLELIRTGKRKLDALTGS